MEFEPFFLSFRLAFVTTLILFFLCVPLAWWLSQTHSKTKTLIESLSALPLVLPPSVLGFYLLVLFSADAPFGRFVEEYLGISLLFRFEGLVVASVLYSFPFMLQPLQSGFEQLSKHMIEASYLSGKGVFTTVLRVALPNIKPSVFTALIVTFAHTVGEFGVVLMVGGSIPEETKVASVAIYEMVETMDYAQAHIYSGVMLAMSFFVLFAVYTYNAYTRRKRTVVR